VAISFFWIAKVIKAFFFMLANQIFPKESSLLSSRYDSKVKVL